MNDKLTELVFILDRSGSMSGLESDTIGGFNAMLSRQKESEGQVIVSTVLFSDQSMLLHDRINIRGVEPISRNDYQVGGSTALLDAIGLAINKIVNAHRHTSADQRAARVLFVITTDGLENASHRFTIGQIHKMIERQQEKYHWEFIFLGANIDAIDTAESFGIKPNRSANFRADSAGVVTNFACLNEMLASYCVGDSIADNWKQMIDEEFAKAE
jgi:uncharacterized protein YegL